MPVRRLLIAVLAVLSALPGQAAFAQGRNSPPTACFTQSPPAPQTGEPVTFDSGCSSDRDGTIAGVSWDLNGDNVWHDLDDRGVRDQPTAVKTFDRPGTYTVQVGVADDDGRLDGFTQTVTVANRAPSAAFTVSPARPVAGDTVTLTSTATDADGTIARQTWDLDNDGQYDDATGATATWRPSAAGSYSVALRAEDDAGAAGTNAQAIVVGSRPVPRPTTPAGGFDNSGPAAPPPPPPPPALPAQPAPPTLRLLDPFPVVRMRGRTTPRGARLKLFSVRGPHGAIATVRCKGRSCPAKRLRRKIKTKSKRGARTVRFKRLQRFLRGGTVLRVTVRKRGMVGKYTRIRIRRIKVPVRVDRCVRPGSARPKPCPEAR